MIQFAVTQGGLEMIMMQPEQYMLTVSNSLLGRARVTKKPKNRTENSKTELNRNRKLTILEKPN